MKRNNLLFITSLVGLSLGLASCNDTAPKKVAVKSVTISGPTTVVEGDSIQLTATVDPDNATDKTLTWSSEQENFATVNEQGLVTAIAAGTVTIKATASNGVFGSYQVTVEKRVIPASSVVISGPTTVEKNETITLTATVNPDDATDKSVTWSSENTAVATVDNGVVTGVSKGNATIKATASNGVFGSYDIIVTEHFAINYPVVEGAAFNGPNSAEEGEYVSFEIISDDLFSSVKVNGEECGRTGDNFFFYMPAGAASITVEKESVLPPVTTYSITSTSRVVHLVGETTREANARVELGYIVDPGYQVTDARVYRNISAFDPADRIEIQYSYNDGIIGFDMPDEDVEIEFFVSRNSYALSFKSDDPDALSQVGNVYDSEGKVIRTVEGNIRHVPYGTNVKVTLNNNSSYYNKRVKATGLRIGGVDYLVEEGGSEVFFNMPYHAVEAEVLYEYNYRTFTLTNSDNITLSAFKKVDGEYVELTSLQAVCDETIYLKATIAEGSGVEVNTVTAVYQHAVYSYDVKVTVSEPNEEGYYSFVMPEASNPVRVTVSEVNPNKYAGKDFVGSFVGFNLYGGKPYNEPSLNKTLSIAASGIMTIGTSTYEIDSVDEENGILTTTDEYLVGYAGNFIYSRYNLSSSLVFGNDIYVYYKLAEGETSASIKVYATQTPFSGRANSIVQIYKDGVNVDNLFLHATASDFSTYEVYAGIKLVFSAGEKVSDTGEVAFEVRTSDDAYICEFSGTNTTKSELVYSVSDGLKGTYTNAEKGDLVLDGVGNASLAGEAGYSYVVNESNQVVVSRETNTSKDTYVVTLGNGTYVVDDEQHETLVSSIFRGFTFTGTHLDYWGDSEAVQVVFDDKAGDITGKIVIGGQYAHHDFGFTAVYDEFSSNLTLTIVSELYSEGFVDQVLTVSVSEGQITFTSTFTGSNAQTYNILNCVCSNANFHIS